MTWVTWIYGQTAANGAPTSRSGFCVRGSRARANCMSVNEGTKPSIILGSLAHLGSDVNIIPEISIFLDISHEATRPVLAENPIRLTSDPATISDTPAIVARAG